jgi:hypothetical protein
VFPPASPSLLLTLPPLHHPPYRLYPTIFFCPNSGFFPTMASSRSVRIATEGFLFLIVCNRIF